MTELFDALVDYVRARRTRELVALKAESNALRALLKRQTFASNSNLIESDAALLSVMNGEARHGETIVALAQERFGWRWSSAHLRNRLTQMRAAGLIELVKGGYRTPGASHLQTNCQSK